MSNFSQFLDIKFGIQNNLERNSWASYFLFGVLSSLIGDTLVLVASSQKCAFKINIILVIIIQHIAISDVINTITFLLPKTISLLAKSWVLGPALCYASVYSFYVAVPAGMWFIATLTVAKFLILKYPFRVASWSTKKVHQICSIIWTSSLLYPILFLAVDKDDIHFSYRVYNCDYKYTSDSWSKIKPITVFIFGAVPNTAIVATALPTMKYLLDARKHAIKAQGRVSWQGALTVALTASVYCISTFPFIIYNFAKSFVKENPPGLFHLHFYRICNFLFMINVVANFYIYIVTIKSFREFILSKFRELASGTLRTSRIRESSSGTPGNSFAVL